VWVALVALRPGTTFHLAPLIAALVGPVVARLCAGTALPATRAAVQAGMGETSVLAAASVLAMVGWLRGPSLWAPLPAGAETFVAAALGALWGWRLASRRRAGLLFAHECDGRSRSGVARSDR
jgi:hypothetical protein